MKTIKLMKKSILCALCSVLLLGTNAHSATVVATVNGMPVTDTDITSRVHLMSLQGQNYTDNRRRALSNIIEDHIKLSYAESLKLAPTDTDVNTEIRAMESRGLDTSGISVIDKEMMKFAVRANIAWQIVIGRTIMPTVNVTAEDIRTETRELERTSGLPIEITFIRLVGIPESVAAQLTKPKSCDAAETMAKALGGAPQKITMPEYELAEDIRARLAELTPMTWSKREDSSVLLVCSRKKMKEYENLDDMIKQNAMYKRALFIGDQQLKQLRRRAIVVIKDDRYK